MIPFIWNLSLSVPVKALLFQETKVNLERGSSQGIAETLADMSQKSYPQGGKDGSLRD
jgi:hypothetical protein